MVCVKAIFGHYTSISCFQKVCMHFLSCGLLASQNQGLATILPQQTTQVMTTPILTFGAGHEGSKFHVAIWLSKFHQNFLEGVELAALGIHIVLVHLQKEGENGGMDGKP